MFEIVHHDTAAAFLARATPWLMRSEAENNLILGIAGRLRDGHNPYEAPVSLITVESRGQVAGCAWRTPPHNLGLTRLPEAALAPLLASVARRHPRIPGMVGPRSEVGSAAALWAAPRRLEVRTVMDLRIYELDAVRSPTRPPAGRYRRALPADRETLIAWTGAFQVATGAEEGPREDRERFVDRLLSEGAIGVWEDGGLASMAAAVSPTPSGIRVNLVYTPSELRSRGYASACVAALSQAQLDAGRRFCFLYTDLANPHSNSIYQQIGYRPVCDALEVEFTALEAASA